MPDALRKVVDQLIDRPPPELDHILDAAASCFSRHGLAHTSVPEIARELGVSRATMYRQIGPVDDFARLILARDAHRLVDEVATKLEHLTGPDAVLTLTVTTIRFAATHPLIRKVLSDEPHLVGEFLPRLPTLFGAVTALLTPYLADQMVRGHLRASDPAVVADLIVRLTAGAILVPPPDLDAHVRGILLPHLEP
jgi:AcrR family transcriptional regulator